MLSQLYYVRWGLVLCIITIIFSFVLGGTMGAREDLFKNHFKSTVKANAEKVFANDKAKMDRAEERAWTYTKRSHMHAAGVGVIGLALLLPLPFITSYRKLTQIAAIGYGAGAFCYSLAWLIAGFRIPVFGTTTAAKASIEWLVAPSIFLMVAAATVILVLMIRWGLSREAEAASTR